MTQLLIDLHGIGLPSHLETLPSFETRSKLENLPYMNDFDIDDNIFKVQMKCFSLFPNLKEQQKSGRSPFTVS